MGLQHTKGDEALMCRRFGLMTKPAKGVCGRSDHSLVLFFKQHS